MGGRERERERDVQAQTLLNFYVVKRASAIAKFFVGNYNNCTTFHAIL